MPRLSSSRANGTHVDLTVFRLTLANALAAAVWGRAGRQCSEWGRTVSTQGQGGCIRRGGGAAARRSHTE
jgi:hypothetical protein